MSDYKYTNVKVTVKIDKLFERDDHLVFYVNGNSLDELNEDARNLIRDYKIRNGVTETAYYSLFEMLGKDLASTVNAVGRV